MSTPLYVIRRLMFMTHGLVDDYLPSLDHVITDGHLDNSALRHVENILTRIRRDDVLEIFQQTMAGNFALLEEGERRLHNLNQFHYRFTQNNNPVRRETSGRTENGNTVAHTQDPAQNDREDGADLSRLSAPRPREARDARTNRPRAEQRGKRPSRSSHQLSSREPVPPQSSASSSTNPPPEEPRQPPRCCICEGNIQGIQTSNQVWFDIRQTLNKLRPQQRLAFIHVINAYDPNILNTIQFNAATLSDEVVNDLIRSLQRCHLPGSKCVLCLLNYVLQRVGRLDLAIEIRMIRTRYLFCVAPSVL
ncbi:Hypothetical predicted protein [Paramuricea clavata]|uniref:Uncharacterized protein n=2 Tax=Paramuricea clavata TaxID=317549 RepID=A0A7D9EVR3_PARCT|nr:Hypothetical predicted protein [Paramuricea clavata]